MFRPPLPPIPVERQEIDLDVDVLFGAGKFENVATKRCLGGARSRGGTLYTFTGSCSHSRTTWTTTPGSPRKFRNVEPGLCMDGPGGDPEGVGLKDCDAAGRWSIAA